jgi:hypothetical protein
VEGGEETLVLDQPRAGYWGYWAMVEEGIYFVNVGVETAAHRIRLSHRNPLCRLRHQRGRSELAPHYYGNFRRCSAELVERWAMDLFRFQADRR